ncbi:Uncharacterised protein [Mycobacteroides abscessus subsp. abscessus]|nr:Uncharacterised protein [Mycobacteroides abscessus subsp. abscessus]
MAQISTDTTAKIEAIRNEFNSHDSTGAPGSLNRVVKACRVHSRGSSEGGAVWASTLVFSEVNNM